MLQRCGRSSWKAVVAIRAVVATSPQLTRLPSSSLQLLLRSSPCLPFHLVRLFSLPSTSSSSSFRPTSRKRKAVTFSSPPIQSSPSLTTSRPSAPPQFFAASSTEEVEEETGAVVVELKEDEDALSEAESEAVWGPVREALEREGSFVTAEGEELLSIAEIERRLQAGELQTEEEEGEEEHQESEEEEEEGGEEEVGDLPPSPSHPIRPRRSDPPSQTMWVQERSDGSVSVTPWPFDDSDPLPDPYESPPPRSPSSLSSTPHVVVGSSIGGEKVRVVDVLELRERDLQEHFSKGGGKGGQKVNKTSNCVHLHHVPTGTIVKCHATRSLADNRRIARSIMKGRLEELLLGPASSNKQRQQKIQKSKAKARKRTKEKYGGEPSLSRSLVSEEPALPLAVDSRTRVVELQMTQTALSPSLSATPTVGAGAVGAVSRSPSVQPAVRAVRRRRPVAQSAVEVE